jgi:hypothetical protein
MHDFMVLGMFPKCWYTWQKLVEAGLGLFTAKEPDGRNVMVGEPLAVFDIMQYFASRGRNALVNIHRTLQTNQGEAFEAAVLLVMTRLLQSRKPLTEIVTFKQPASVPEWAHLPAQIVRRSSDGLEDFDWDYGSDVPTANLARFAKNVEDVKAWLESGTTAWCLPGDLMGPDLMTRVRLSDERVVLLVIQVKCYTSDHKTTVPASVAAHAIRSLSSKTWYYSLVCGIHSQQM